jgi:hypothetical protein
MESDNRSASARLRSQKSVNVRMAGHSARTTVIYDGTVTYESVIRELFARMPDLEPLYGDQFSYLDGEELPYVVFGSFLIPILETALERHEDERIRSICAYLEEVALNANSDVGLKGLLRVEIGEWLSGTPLEAEVGPYLGEQTKRICQYVSGLATQRNLLRAERARRNR